MLRFKKGRIRAEDIDERATEGKAEKRVLEDCWGSREKKVRSGKGGMITKIPPGNLAKQGGKLAIFHYG